MTRTFLTGAREVGGAGKAVVSGTDDDRVQVLAAREAIGSERPISPSRSAVGELICVPR